MSRRTITIEWSIEDIEGLEFASSWNEEKCERYLDYIENALQDRSIELGWDIIDNLLEDFLKENPDCIQY